jgi:excisionase family DNA binding protein
MRTLSLSEAAALLRMHPEEVRRRAKRGTIPAAKPGRSWIFIEDDLAEYVRSLYAMPRQALRVTPGKEVKQCHSTNAEGCGGFASLHQPVSALDALLAQPTKHARKNSMTE